MADETPQWLEGLNDMAKQELFTDANTDVRIHQDGGKVIAVIRTSDRISFKRCRRRWGWQSHLRHNLGPKQAQSPLWLGSGFHYALEDLHGYNFFKDDPVAAFDAYVAATSRKGTDKLPGDWVDLVELARGMLEYYQIWLKTRDPLKTYWEDGKPQVEVNFKVPIPFDATKWGIDEVIYSGQIDRVVIDEDGALWLVDYKTAKYIQTLHYALDPQVSTYMWIAPYLYDRPIAGFMYQQHKKITPRSPDDLLLVRGGVTVAQNTVTTRAIYRQALIKAFGSVDKAPIPNKEFLNALTAKETPDKDPFIQRDYIYRNEVTGQSVAKIVLMECEDMLNPDLPLYPNQTRECASMCPFNGPCVSMDDGSDYQTELDLISEPRAVVYDEWRKHIKYPADADTSVIDFEEVAQGEFAMENYDDLS